MPCEAVSDFPEQVDCLQQSAPALGISPFFRSPHRYLPNAVMYGAELVAERRFCTFHSAAGAVDHFRCDRHLVEFRPQCSGFLAQDVAICKRCDSGVAGFAVQSAATDQLVCVFHRYLHKSESKQFFHIIVPFSGVWIFFKG